MAAAVEQRRPWRCILDLLRPPLTQECRQHARLRQRRFADARVAEQDRELAALASQYIDHLDRLTPAPEEEIGVGRGRAAYSAKAHGVASPALTPRRSACRPSPRRPGLQ